MKIRWPGRTAVSNIFGDWAPGETKEVPDGTVLPGFEIIETGFFAGTSGLNPQPAKKQNWRKKPMSQKLHDKFERDNLETRD